MEGNFICITEKSTSPLFWNPDKDPVEYLTTFSTNIFDANGAILASVETDDVAQLVTVNAKVPSKKLDQLWKNITADYDR